jgi:protein-S-isoprenylcysteine O-methyltransferase Ste14
MVIATAAVMEGLSLISPESAIPIEWRLGISVSLFIAAGIFGAPAFRAFGKAKTTINPVDIDRASTLVTTGIYARTRNPMYVGLSLILLSFAAWLGQLAPTIGPLFFVWFTTQFQIMPEERVLATKFGSAYSDYQQSVRRWL